MQVRIEVVGLIDKDLGIREDNHVITVELQEHSWKALDWEARAMFLDELTDTVRHSLTKYGQADYKLIANQKEGLEYDEH